MCSGPRPVGSIETPQEDDLSRKFSSEVSRINTLYDQQVDSQAPEVEESETLKREEKAKLTPIGDVQYHNDLSKVTLQNKTSQRDIKDGTPSFHEEVNETTHIRDLVAQETFVGNPSITPRLSKETVEITIL